MANWDTLKENVTVGGFHIDSAADKLDNQIEPHVKPLVLALNKKGYETTASCEGHTLSYWEERMQRLQGNNAKLVYRAKRGLTYHITREDGKTEERTFHETPWVDVLLSDNQRENLGTLLQYHNQRTGIHWRGRRFASPIDKYRIEIVPRYDLETMQKDIKELAEDILSKG